jgi:hypothetical protein
MFSVALSKMWTVWRSALVIVKPETSSHGIVVVSNDIGVGVLASLVGRQFLRNT